MSLEPYLEALPSMLVMQYMMRTNPAFFHSFFALWRAFYMTGLGMTLFLKNGPCFILPRHGIFGVITWRFIVAFLISIFSLNTKYTNLVSAPTANPVIMTSFGAIVALLSLHEGLGCWKSVCKMVMFCPPLVILPVFGFFTFGRPEEAAEGVKSLAVSRKWTIVNMFGSCLLSLVRYMSNLPYSETMSQHAWILQQPGAEKFTNSKGVGTYLYCILNTVFAMLLTLLLLRKLPECGVLLPHLPGVLHVVQGGEVLPLIQPPPPTYTRWVQGNYSSYGCHKYHKQVKLNY